MTMSTEQYAHKSTEILIKLLVEKGVLTEQDRKHIHETVVAELTQQSS